MKICTECGGDLRRHVEHEGTIYHPRGKRGKGVWKEIKSLIQPHGELTKTGGQRHLCLLACGHRVVGALMFRYEPVFERCPICNGRDMQVSARAA